jgi:hypothetical protein
MSEFCPRCGSTGFGCYNCIPEETPPMTDAEKAARAAERRQGITPNDPLPTLDCPDENPPAFWWGRNRTGELTKVYRSYEDFCND